jgi:G:T-mismatch repair DNA endonuclease (very short patch repair protein)
LPKLKRNIARDEATNAYLRNNGWKVIRLWEHELVNAEEIANKIKDSLEKGQ